MNNKPEFNFKRGQPSLSAAALNKLAAATPRTIVGGSGVRVRAFSDRIAVQADARRLTAAAVPVLGILVSGSVAGPATFKAVEVADDGSLSPVGEEITGIILDRY